MAIDDITHSANSLAAAAGVDIQPSAGVRQQIIAVATKNDNTDTAGTMGLNSSTAGFYILLYDGTTRGTIAAGAYPAKDITTTGSPMPSLAPGIIIDNTNYLRLYNDESGTRYYNVQMLEV